MLEFEQDLYKKILDLSQKLIDASEFRDPTFFEMARKSFVNTIQYYAQIQKNKNNKSTLIDHIVSFSPEDNSTPQSFLNFLNKICQIKQQEEMLLRAPKKAPRPFRQVARALFLHQYDEGANPRALFEDPENINNGSDDEGEFGPNFAPA